MERLKSVCIAGLCIGDYCRPPTRRGLRVFAAGWNIARALGVGANGRIWIISPEHRAARLAMAIACLSIGDSMIKLSALGRSATAASTCPSHHIPVYHIRITSQKVARTACGSVCTVPYTGVMFWSASLVGGEPSLFGLCPVVRASIQ